MGEIQTRKALTGADGREVKATTAFVPTEPSGEITVTFTFDASALAGHDLVAFEAVTRASADGGDVTVATHRDIEDVAQTVTVTQPPTTTRRMPQTGVPATAPIAGLVGLGLLTAGVTTAALRRKGKDR